MLWLPHTGRNLHNPPIQHTQNKWMNQYSIKTWVPLSTAHPGSGHSSYFLLCWDKWPWPKHLKQGFILTHSPKVQSITARKSRQLVSNLKVPFGNEHCPRNFTYVSPHESCWQEHWTMRTAYPLLGSLQVQLNSVTTPKGTVVALSGPPEPDGNTYCWRHNKHTLEVEYREIRLELETPF